MFYVTGFYSIKDPWEGFRRALRPILFEDRYLHEKTDRSDTLNKYFGVSQDFAHRAEVFL